MSFKFMLCSGLRTIASAPTERLVSLSSSSRPNLTLFFAVYIVAHKLIVVFLRGCVNVRFLHLYHACGSGRRLRFCRLRRAFFIILALAARYQCGGGEGDETA